LVFAARESSVTGLYTLGTDSIGAPVGQAARLQIASPMPQGAMHVSPDGSRVAIVGEWDLTYIVNVPARSVTPLFGNGQRPEMVFFEWHPDNRHVLIRTESGYPDTGLWLVDTDTGEHKAIVTDRNAGVFRDAAVSPDGQRIVYSTSRGLGDTGRIWITDVNGDTPTVVYSAMNADLFGLAWSPDGSKIAFVGQGLKVMNADGSDVRTLSQNFADGLLFEPIWSPDGRALAFIAWDGPGAFSDKRATPEGADPWEQWDNASFKGTNIHLVDVATGVERALLPDTGNIDPAWSPDGKHIAFATNRSGKSEIWAVNADGTNLRQASHTGVRVRYPFWLKKTDR
jgi:Tol biopolymer transport system component